MLLPGFELQQQRAMRSRRPRRTRSAKLVPERHGEKAVLEGRYDISQDRAVSGGNGVVFKAEDKQVRGRTVAIKRIHAMAEGQHEVAIMKELDHPRICRILETVVNRRDEVLFIVMEDCQGGDVFDRVFDGVMVMRSGPLGEEAAADIVRQLATALKYIHRLGIAHRDLKPENVCFCSGNPEDTSVKVVDWGHACRFGPEAGMRGAWGTQEYRAPEMTHTGPSYTEACDLWCLGVMTYVMLSKLLPFGRKPEIEDMRSERYQLTNIINASDAQDLIRNLLRASPEQRLSAEEVLAHPWVTAWRRQDIGEAVVSQVLSNMWRFARASFSVATYATVVAKQLDHRSHHELTRVFDCLDVNSDGALSLDELRGALEATFGVSSEKLQELEEVFAELDLDGSGTVEYTEFAAAALGDHVCAGDEALQAAFIDFDSGDEIRRELSRADTSPTVEEALPEHDLTIQQWVHQVRTPSQRLSRQPLRFET